MTFERVPGFIGYGMNDLAPPPDPPSSRNRPNYGLLVLQTLIGLVVFGVIVSAFLPLFGRMTPTARASIAASKVRMVLLACRSYAADHGGAYPPDLAALFPDYIDTEDYHLSEDGRGGKVPMIYYSGLTTSSDPEAIVIEHRVLYAKKRVVGKVGGHIKLLPVD